jgi:uracil-DNA glycosylase
MPQLRTRPAQRQRWQMHSPPTSPSNLCLVILGEAPGTEEVAKNLPFVGPAGQLLRNTLFPEAGLNLAQWHVLNTFSQRPPDNNLDLWTANKTELKRAGLPAIGHPLRKRYLLPEHRWQLEETATRLRELQPDLILALGGTALWFLSGESAISQYRGNFFNSPYGRAVATFHPTSVLRQWEQRPIVWSDLRKTARFIAGDLPAPAKRRLWINPTWAEIANVYARFARNPTTVLGVDIETAPSLDQITTVAFGSTNEAICIPLWDKAASTQEKQNAWATAAEETKAWRWVERFANLPNPKVMQNGLYDSQYFLDAPIDIRLRNWQHDTAILQHATQPELPKALGVLASLHLNEPSWKQMRTSAKDENKADD